MAVGADLVFLADLALHRLRAHHGARFVEQRHIGVVLQDPLLFNDTVRSNIAYGRPDATPADIDAAARAAHAYDFIQRLPDKYETSVGERGARLSVGERQRIEIVRALLLNPKLLIMDEPTSVLTPDAVQMLLDRRVTESILVTIEPLCEGHVKTLLAHLELLKGG